VTCRPPHQICEEDTNGEQTVREAEHSDANDSGMVEEISPTIRPGTQTTTFVFPANLAFQPMTGDMLQMPLQNINTLRAFTIAATPITGSNFRPILPKPAHDQGGVPTELAQPSTSKTLSSESPPGAPKSRAAAARETRSKPTDTGKRPRDLTSSSDDEKENRTQDPDFRAPRDRARKRKASEKRKRSETRK